MFREVNMYGLKPRLRTVVLGRDDWIITMIGRIGIQCLLACWCLCSGFSILLIVI